MIGAMDKHGAAKGVIIYSEKLSSVARKVCPPSTDGWTVLMRQTMQEMSSEYHIEEFPEAELLVNITKHFLVPKHTIMKPDEKAALIKK